MSVPVSGFEEDGEDSATPKHRMKGQTFEETMKGMGTALSEIWPKPVTADIFHFVLVRKRGNCAGGIFPIEGFVEEDEVREAAANGEGGFLERFKISLEGKD